MKTYFKIKSLITIFFIFVFAFSIRLYGINWDQGQHLHPDERFLTMVTNDIKLPQNIGQYFNTEASPLNPYNYPSYQFFVYGTFPIFLTKLLAVIFNVDTYGKIHLLGRGLSAFFDASNIFLLFLLARKLIRKPFLRFIPSLLYSLTVLPLQLSHFYAVDTFLSTFLLATFVGFAYNLIPLAAVFFGLALSCKISAVYLAPVIALFFFKQLITTKKIFNVVFSGIVFIVISFSLFRVFQPYSFVGLFTPNPKFISSLQSLRDLSDPHSTFPPSIQWLNRWPLVHSLGNIAFFGLGLPLFLFFLFSLTRFRRRFDLTAFMLVWILSQFLIQGSQFAHNLRYFLPIYPFMILFSISLLSSLHRRYFIYLCLFQVVTAAAFLNIYLHPHSRVQAAYWIYDHLPSGSTITNETWDDPLPFYLPHLDPNEYHGLMLNLYDPDTAADKWPEINKQLDSADYLIMSSNRLWGSIPRVPNLYPQTAKFYRDLFDGSTDFQKLIEINSYPGFSLPFMTSCYYFGPTNFPGLKNSWFSLDSSCAYPGIYFRDDISEESFTVYDHPKVLIFQKRQPSFDNQTNSDF